MLRRIERWAKRKEVEVVLTGIDLNPYAARAAMSLSPGQSQIQWVTGDAFVHREPVDVVLSSLFTHHLEEVEIVTFLEWSEENARLGWFVNDLCREETPCRAFSLLARMMGWHRFVQHDGCVSFQRSFQEDDWERMIADANISPTDVRLARWRPGRLCVERLK